VDTRRTLLEGAIEPPHTVTRKHPPTFATNEDGTPTLRRAKGCWWFILECSCPAAASGYAVCWHKASVFRWWQRNRRVDGDAYADLPPHSNRVAQAAGDLDPDGVETFKDRPDPAALAWAEKQQRKCWDEGWCDGNEWCGMMCECAACDLAKRGVPLTSPDVDFDDREYDDGPMSSGTCDDLQRVELPW
jgi:hypothetical protein